MFSFETLETPGLFLISCPRSADDRGVFSKSFMADEFEQRGLFFQLREEFHSISHVGVLRGMHFQAPPFDHTKLVTCLAGHIFDVILDLRKESSTYGKAVCLELSGDKPQLLWIPSGLAHGFLSLQSGSIVSYQTDREYAPESDFGVRWDSFGVNWPISRENVIISQRDRQHPSLDSFDSPF